MPMRALLVAVCTFRRDSVVTTLRSLFVQTLKPEAILIIDNDAAPFSKERVLALAGETDIRLDYRHVPGQNIAIARNAALDVAQGNLLAFIDDDAYADPFWLARLRDQLGPTTAAVFGPQQAVYSARAPYWMRALAPHSSDSWMIDGALQSGSTGNCLINLAHPALAFHRFSDSLAPQGGTDTQFFVEAYREGARYEFANDAVVFEPVLPERATWRWLIRRRYRYGHSFARATQKVGPGAAALALVKASYCFAMAGLRAYDPIPTRAATLRGMVHVGVAAAALGIRPPVEYPTAPPKIG